MVGGIVKIIQSMTLTHVLILALLLVILAPTYILWRFVNDASLLNKWTSFYEELSTDKSPCTLRIASVRGSDPTYAISTGFAFQGSDRWTISAVLSRKPDEGDLVSYCEALNRIVDHMRRPETAKSPTYPNSDEEIIWHYRPEESP